MRRLIPVALTLAGTLAMSPSYAATQQYVAGSAGDANVVCRTTPTVVNIGGACFARGAGTASVKVADLHGAEVGFWFRAKDSGGTTIGELTFGGCATATAGKTIALPTGTAKVDILLDGPAFTALDCPDGLPATNGTITLT